jgi:hypothetical protein
MSYFEVFKTPFYDTTDNGGGTGEQTKDQGEQTNNQQADDKVTGDEGTDKSEDNKQDDRTGDFIPKSTALKWKRELNELRREKSKRDAMDFDKNIQTNMENIRSMCKEKGYDDDFTDIITQGFKPLYEAIPRKGDEIDQEVEDEVLEYSNPEIIKYKKDIADTVRKYRKVDENFSVEQAIRLLPVTFKPVNEKDLKTQIEQENLLSRRNQEGKTINTSGSVPLKDEIVLSEDDKRILEMMKRNRPDRSWDAKKYVQMKSNQLPQKS